MKFISTFTNWFRLKTFSRNLKAKSGSAVTLSARELQELNCQVVKIVSPVMTKRWHIRNINGVFHHIDIGSHKYTNATLGICPTGTLLVVNLSLCCRPINFKYHAKEKYAMPCEYSNRTIWTRCRWTLGRSLLGQFQISRVGRIHMS